MTSRDWEAKPVTSADTIRRVSHPWRFLSLKETVIDVAFSAGEAGGPKAATNLRGRMRVEYPRIWVQLGPTAVAEDPLKNQDRDHEFTITLNASFADSGRSRKEHETEPRIDPRRVGCGAGRCWCDGARERLAASTSHRLHVGLLDHHERPLSWSVSRHHAGQRGLPVARRQRRSHSFRRNRFRRR